MSSIKTLSASQLEQYHAQGFISIEGALPGPLLGQLRDVTDSLLEEARGLDESDHRFDLEPSHNAAEPRVRRLKSPYLHWPFFDHLLRDQHVLDVIEPILGPDMRFHNNKLNVKAPGFGAAVEWHQDWAFYPHTNDDGLAVGIYLDDVTEENSPMMVVPKTHTGPVFDHHVDGSFCGAIDPTRAAIDFENAVSLTGPAGTMTVHHVRAVHGSQLNRSDRPRRLLLHGYFAADAWPLQRFADGDSLAAFEARMVRGSSTPRPRLRDVPVQMPLPEAPHQGSIYENQNTIENRYFDTFEEAVV
jgi:phytanoyl-CoA hydroxylase